MTGVNIFRAMKWHNTMKEIKKERESKVVKVMARDSNNMGAKMYCSLGKDHVQLDFSQDLNLYEVLDWEAPTRLYFDMDFETTDNFNVDPPWALRGLRRAVEEYVAAHNLVNVNNRYDPKLFAKCCVTRCVRPHKPNKHSYHLSYPDAVFGDVEDVKVFVLRMARWMFETHWSTYDWMAFQKQGKVKKLGRCVFDLSVYTKDRLMRTVNQSKSSDPGCPLKLLSPWEHTAEDAVIQPFEYRANRGKAVNVPSPPVECELMKAIVKRDPRRLYTYVVRLEESLLREGQNHTMPPCLRVAPKNMQYAKNAVVLPGTSKFGMRCELAFDKIPNSHIVIEKDEDFLDHVHADYLKSVEYGSVFLPFLHSVSYSVDREKLARWCSSSGTEKSLEKYRKKIDHINQNTRLLCTGDFALKILNGMYGQVDDRRQEMITPYVMKGPLKIDVNPDEWTPLPTGRELMKAVTQDHKRTARHNSKVDHDQEMDIKKDAMDVEDLCSAEGLCRRSCIFVTGQMGAGKSTDIRGALLKMLLMGTIKSVLILVPRVVLASDTLKHMSEMLAEMENQRHIQRHKKREVEFNAFFSNALQDPNVERYCRKVHAADVGTVTVAVVNSICRVDNKSYDYVVVDEPTTCVSNFFMEEKKDEEAGEIVYKDHTLSELTSRLSNIMLRSFGVIFIDAAFTNDSYAACMKMYHGYYTKEEPSREEVGDFLVEKQGVDRSKVRNLLTNIRKDGVWKKLNADTYHFLATPKKYCVYEPRFPRPIIARLYEYADRIDMMDVMYDMIKNDKKIVAYVTTKDCGRFVLDGLQSMCEKEGIYKDGILITADELKKDREDIISKRFVKSYVVVVTSCLGAGSSFAQPDLFHAAFGYFNYVDNSPGVGDVAQLVARVRASTTRELHYHVSCSARHKTVKASEEMSDCSDKSLTYALEMCRNNAEFLASVVRSNLQFAKFTTRRWLQSSLSFVTDATLVGTDPQLTVVDKTVQDSLKRDRMYARQCTKYRKKTREINKLDDQQKVTTVIASRKRKNQDNQDVPYKVVRKTVPDDTRFSMGNHVRFAAVENQRNLPIDVGRDSVFHMQHDDSGSEDEEEDVVNPTEEVLI